MRAIDDGGCMCSLYDVLNLLVLENTATYPKTQLHAFKAYRANLAIESSHDHTHASEIAVCPEPPHIERFSQDIDHIFVIAARRSETETDDFSGHGVNPLRPSENRRFTSRLSAGT
jgi:hypothetical protein